MASLLNLCDELGVPVALEKTDWADEIVIFLGILLNGSELTLGLSVEKHDCAIEMLKLMLSKRKAKVMDLQKLCSFLNFVGKAVFPG